MFRVHRPEVVLMDLRMPQMDGLTAIRAIVSEFPEARIIVLTSADEENENRLRAGARVVVLKDVPGGVLLRTIRTEHRLPRRGWLEKGSPQSALTFTPLLSSSSCSCRQAFFVMCQTSIVCSAQQ